MYEETLEPYIVRPGTKNFGEKYEVVFTTYAALRLSLNTAVKNFQITSNENSWGDFDDSVFEIEYTNSKKIVAVQLKHVRQNVTYEKLTSTKGDYSLDKYYKSYKEIGADKKNSYFVLYKTGGCNKSVENFRWKKHQLQQTSTILEFLPGVECFQFRCDDSSKKSEFLSKFYVYTNQKNCSQMENEVRSLVTREFGSSVEVEEVFTFVEKWKKGLLGGHFKLTRNDFVTEVCEVLLAPHVVKPTFKKENLRFVDLWNEIIDCFSVTFVDDDDNTASTIWQTIFQALGVDNWDENNWGTPGLVLEPNPVVPKRYLLNKLTNKNISPKNLYLAFWKSGQVPLFLHYDNNSNLSKIVDILQSTTTRKYFVVATPQENVTRFTRLSKFTKLDDLSVLESDFLETVLSTLCIDIQSRFNLSLDEMISSDCQISHHVTPTLLLEIMQNRSVGVIPAHLPPIYIKRRISAFHVDVKLLKYIRDEIIVIQCDLNTHFDYILTEFSSRVVEFIGPDTILHKKNICVSSYDVPINNIKKFLVQANHPKYHIFLMTQKFGSPILKWIQSSSVDLLKEFVSEAGNVDDEDDLFSNASNPIYVISSPPGMGKSTLINQMCRTCSQNVWILKVELIEHSSYLRGTPTLDYFRNYYYGGDKLARVCFDFFARRGEVVALFDGFDEVAPRFSDTVMGVVEDFRSMGFTQVITTRPSAAHILERKFQVLPHFICPFDSDDKIKFVHEYQTSVGENFRATFNTVLASLLQNFCSKFSDNALQMSMLCETVHSDLSQNRVNFDVDILQLYQKFIDLKFALFERKYLQGCHPTIYDSFTQDIRQLTVWNLEICALIAIFGYKQASYFAKPHNLKFLQELKQGQEKIGLITQVGPGDVPIFLHQTYADYFAATWLVENWKTNKRAKKLLEKLFLVKAHTTIRLFFDRIVAQKVPLFGAVLDQNPDKIGKYGHKDFEFLDDLGRNALHLACSWKLKSDPKFLDLLLQQIDVNCGRDLFNFTPIEWADRTRNLLVIDQILQKGYDFDVSGLKIFANVKWVLLKCIKKKCVTLLKKFADYLNTVEMWLSSSDYDNLLFTAVATNDVEIVKTLLDVSEFRKHIKNQEIHGNAALQLAILLGHETIAKKFVDFDPKTTSYQVAVEEATDDIKQLLKTVNN
ncbi:hypothetical protein Zmor_025198 [Zophobas morio]|uniref:NACHT domain-containing protein n=1 Tax=Zophobas morio TaxID=2755281 RepID=A0AA38HRS2_9CUCU|nr:hypothetical protein Zmor_025198 [Zophobas morio]